MLSWFKRNKEKEVPKYEPSCAVFEGPDKDADDIVIGRRSYYDCEIHPVYRFKGVKDISTLSEFFETLTDDDSEYYLEYKKEDGSYTWVRIAAPPKMDIMKLDTTASLSDIIDKINEMINLINKINRKV